AGAAVSGGRSGGAAGGRGGFVAAGGGAQRPPAAANPAGPPPAGHRALRGRRLMRVIAVVLLAGLIATGSLQAQEKKKKGRCNGAPPDSTWLLRGPVYRDCEVDRKAEVMPPLPHPDYVPMGSPRQGCFSAEFEFVVDTLGQPEFGTVR